MGFPLRAISPLLTFLTFQNVCQLAFRTMLWRWFGLVANIVGCVNKVNQCEAGFLLRWLTVGRWVNQPPRPTQPGHPSWIGVMSASESWDVNRHTTPCTSLLSVVLQCKQVAGWRLRPYGFYGFERTFHFLCPILQMMLRSCEILWRALMHMFNLSYLSSDMW